MAKSTDSTVTNDDGSTKRGLFNRKPRAKKKGPSRLKQIGTRARAGVEELLGTRVHLDLHVAVEADWQRDPKKLDRLGF